MTIWRDLVDLENQGALRRVRGGAVEIKKDVTVVTHETIFPRFDPEHDPFSEQKALIGRFTASELVEEDDIITIEAGTTASSMVPYLHQPKLTVLTNGLVTTLMASRHIPALTVMCSGGILIDTGAFIGPQAQEFFAKFQVNKVFFGAQGLTLEDGFTDPTPLYTQLKAVMKQHAEKIIMLVDSSKIGVRSLIQIMSLAEVDVIVTDPGAPTDIVEGLKKKGIEVYIAE
jgi:DeoR/GlpR family transcriptional regulator of sugar metabolism